MRAQRRPLLLLNAAYLPYSHDWRSAAGRANSPFEAETFIRAARQAEAAGFDAFFQADFSGVNRVAARTGRPINTVEPFQLAALVAATTSRIAVLPTVSTLHTHPFTFARNLASLDRLSRGRAWINVVSSFRPGTALGVARDTTAADRHAQTEEFLTVARRLWTSWPPQATEPDRQTDRFIRDDLITDVDHDGAFYRQPGPIDLPPYSAEFPFTLQATSSLAGLRLAARSADAVFAGTPTLGAARALRSSLRRETEQAGRHADEVALLPGAFLQISRDPAEAAALARAEGTAAKTPSAWAAVQRLRARFPMLELADVSLADPPPRGLLSADPAEVLALHGSRALPLWDLARTPGRSLGELAVAEAALGEHARFTGTPSEIAVELRRWFDEGGVDGFQFILGNDFTALCSEVLPRLLG
ncbi:LLM class flavin-dependent oxidoreductase [Actinoalloteichus hymeniacidonis]|uniref:Luciferase-like domain-containing protein n=1 Tax=Actinoalloteichus hymeniacidonis TaxID=340345 RepID=A0AAC9HP46_9PSEU|nr:LLM class flavin-dependent oxidoreductase [Actinoalloteichus hymeniacidonis]AOS61940.1 hypothetical protein TL08_05565 [Actinoalloteichus hymeniacidonis]MBB5910040.1 alkanesulfonate monooxygenase SsuD/methylene tetrahydromethanopterin reductase-like flavin-dependent oxidoreductase (luciferase family) [Actinoalloteichus hymeniacidonis]